MLTLGDIVIYSDEWEDQGIVIDYDGFHRMAVQWAKYKVGGTTSERRNSNEDDCVYLVTNIFNEVFE